MARVTYRDPDDLPTEDRDLLFLSEASDETANVFRAIANNPPILDSLRRHFGILWAESGPSDRERELVVLAAAHESGSAYEWHQHVRIARAEGIDDGGILAVGARYVDAFDDREALLRRYAFATVRCEVDDALHDRTAGAFDEWTVVGVALLASGYHGLARAISALGVEVDGEFVGWDLADG